MRIEIIPTRKEEVFTRKKNKWILPIFLGIIILFGVGFLCTQIDFLNDDVGDVQINTYEQELLFKGDNPTSVSASGGNLNINVYPEVSKVFQTSNGLSYARHEIIVCNTQVLSITPSDNSFGFRFNQELQDIKISEIVNEPVVVGHNYNWMENIIGQYPNGSNQVVYVDIGRDTYANRDITHDITSTIIQTTMGEQSIYYIPTSLNASGCKDYILEYKPNENDRTLKWDVYMWQGNILTPSSSLLLDPNWVLTNSIFQINNFTGSMIDNINLSLSNTTNFNNSGYAQSVIFCPNTGLKQNWSLADWNVPYPNYGIAEEDTTGMHYYLHMNETGKSALIDEMNSEVWTSISESTHSTDDCVIGNCINSTGTLGGWNRTIADDNGIEGVDLSISGWVKSGTDSCDLSECVVWGYFEDDIGEDGMLIGASAGNGNMKLTVSRTGAGTIVDVSSTIDIMNKEWHFIYGQIGSGNAKIYVDGVLAGSIVDTDVIPSAAYDSNLIGNHKASQVREWNGKIDEFILRTGANAYLTPTQIQDTYQEGVARYDIQVRFGKDNATIVDMPYINISGNGTTSKRELNSSIECMQYKYSGYRFNNGTIKAPYLISLNFSYNAVDIATPSGIINVTNYRIYTDAGTNYTNEDLKTSFTPTTNNTDTSMYGNVSFIKDYDNSTTDTNSLGYGLVFGMHMSNTTDYVGGTNGSEYGGVVAGGSQGYLGKGTEFDGLDDGISKNTLGILMISKEHTVSVWFKSLGNSVQSQTLVANSFSGSDRNGLTISTDNIIRVGHYNGATYIRSASSTPITSSLDEWHHIIYTSDTSTIKLYLDGILQDGTGSPELSLHQRFSIGLDTGLTNKPFNGTIDEVMIWKRALNSSDVLRLYNEQVGSKINDVELINNTESTTSFSSGNTTKGNVWRNEVCIGNLEINTCFGSNSLTVLNSPPTTPIQNYPIDNLVTANYTTNMSCNGSTDVDGDSINYEFYFDNSNPPTTVVQNTTLTKYGHYLTTDGNWYWRCRANDGSAASGYTSARKITVDRRNIIDTNDYSKNSVGEGETIYFESNITINQHRISKIPSALLTYNNTNYTATIATINSSYYKAFVSLTVPQITFTPTTKNFFWLYDNQLLNGSVEVNQSITTSQTVYKIQLFNCTDNSVNASQVMVFNYTFQDEQEGVNLSVDFDATYTVWNQDNNINSIFSIGLVNETKVGICYTPKNQTYITEASIKYVQNTYDTRWYYYQQYPTVNATHNRILYLLSQFKGGVVLAENIQFTVLDGVGNPLSDYLIYVDKYYEDLNTYPTVAMGKTDSFGKTYIYLDKLTTIYRIRAEHNNINYYTGVSGIIGTTSYPEIRIGVVTQADILSIIDSVETSLDYNNDTKTITATYNYGGAENINITLDVYERRHENDTWICSETVYNTKVGTINCYYGNKTGGRYIATLSVGHKSSTIAKNSLEIDLTSTLIKDLMGGDGLWITALMVLTLFFVGLWKPEVSIILGIVGLLLSWMIGFIYLSWGVVIAIIIMGIFLIVRGSR